MLEKENDHGWQPGTTVWDHSHPRDKHPILGMLRDVPTYRAGYSFTASLSKILHSNYSLLSSYITLDVLLYLCLGICLKIFFLEAPREKMVPALPALPWDWS